MIRTNLECLNLFLSSKSPEEKSRMLRFLPDAHKRDLIALPAPVHVSNLPAHSSEEFILLVHPEWIDSLLESYSDHDKALIIEQLSPDQSHYFYERYRLENKGSKSEATIKRYILSTLAKWMRPSHPPLKPLSALPSFKLFFLLGLSLTELDTLIFYLGLHDLAPEVKKVIESRLLKDVERVLSEKEKSYLKLVMKKTPSVQFAPLKLSGWDRREESFKEVIDSRGLNRLAKALYGCDPSFLWYFLHRLDKKRAQILQKLSVDLKNPKAHDALVDEIVNTYQTFSKDDG